MTIRETLIKEITEFTHAWNEHAVFSIGLLLLTGVILGKLVNRFKLPDITGFLLAGFLIGPHVGGFISLDMKADLGIVTDIALGIIAATIGSEFSISKIKRTGTEVIVITIVQLLVTFTLVTFALMWWGMDILYASLLGAIASATAPAATVAIVQSLRARGRFVDTLYGIVALDDAGCVILFGIIFSLVSGILATNLGITSYNNISNILAPFKEISLSLLLGSILGVLLHFIVRKRKSDNETLIFTLGILFMGIGLSFAFHLSPLLVNMTLGAVLINISSHNHRILRNLTPLSPLLYALFFAVAGAELNPSIFTQKNILFLGIIYTISRAVGKYGGVYIGCKLAKSPQKITNYLGLCMLPQAGVAIGLVLLIQNAPFIQSTPPEIAAIFDNMASIVLLSVFINAFTGPPLSKFSIVRGNEMEKI